LCYTFSPWSVIHIYTSLAPVRGQQSFSHNQLCCFMWPFCLC
jgi:hypothetical protein